MPVSLAEREKSALFHTYDRLAIGEVTHAEGSYIHTASGEKYLDLICGLGVTGLGHSHPKIVSAITEQAGKYLHLSNLYLQEPQVRLAEQIKALSGYDKVFFCNSGTEAVEGALKLARKYASKNSRYQIFGLTNAFHGRTYGPLSLMDNAKYRAGFTPLLDGMACIDPSDLAASITEHTAAIILECIQGEGGIREVSPETVTLLKSLQKDHGILLIADEIQSGAGRTGTFFSFETLGLKPDIVVAAKAIGGGLPLGAIIANDEVASAFTPGVHGTTFGGNALSCVAGSALLDELASGVMDQVNTTSAWFFNELNTLKEKYPDTIGEIRGKGMMIGIELGEQAKKVQLALLEQQIITNVTATSVLRLLPPLNIEQADLEKFLTVFESILVEQLAPVAG